MVLWTEGPPRPLEQMRGLERVGAGLVAEDLQAPSKASALWRPEFSSQLGLHPLAKNC